MDADSGRILYEKNGNEQLAMASTTKIMTCIIALENAEMDMIVTASKEAQMQPKVHLGMKEGEQFYLKDLLYSLMLESHNDSAVVIAEAVGKSVKGFADMMNQKAIDLGCVNTNFVTPNGLDETLDGKEHFTTAADLARIMKYCIHESPKKDVFLEITGTASYTFTNIDKTEKYQCYNRNSLLTLMEGAFSGKTGYTGKAGYCYVGALERDGKTFIVSLLACGWPNNKNYKWSDARKLLEYALENYEYKNLNEDVTLQNITVKNGVSNENGFYQDGSVSLQIEDSEIKEIELLLREDEQVEVLTELPGELEAPIEKNEVIGLIRYVVDGEEVAKSNIIACQNVEKKTMLWYFKQILELYSSI